MWLGSGVWGRKGFCGWFFMGVRGVWEMRSIGREDFVNIGRKNEFTVFLYIFCSK